MVGVAAGFALEGFHPIAHSLSPFMAERPVRAAEARLRLPGPRRHLRRHRRVVRLRHRGRHAPRRRRRVADARDPAACRCSSPGIGRRGRAAAAGDVRGRRADLHADGAATNDEPRRRRARADRGRAPWLGSTACSRSGRCSTARCRPPPASTRPSCTPRACGRSTTPRSKASLPRVRRSRSSSRGTRARRRPSWSRLSVSGALPPGRDRRAAFVHPCLRHLPRPRSRARPGRQRGRRAPAAGGRLRQLAA